MRHLYKNHGSVPSDKGKGSVCVLAIEALIGNKICLHQGIFVSYGKRKEKVIRNSRFIIPLPLKTRNKLELEFGFRNQ